MSEKPDSLLEETQTFELKGVGFAGSKGFCGGARFIEESRVRKAGGCVRERVEPPVS